MHLFLFYIETFIQQQKRTPTLMGNNNIIIEHQYLDFKWIDITDPSEATLHEIATTYNLDYILMADSFEYGHLPKIEKLPDYTFMILRAYTATDEDRVTTVGQLSNKIAFFLKENLLISIHRAKFDFLAHVKKTCKHENQLLLDIIDRMIATFEKPLQEQSNVIDNIEKVIFIKSSKPVSLEDLYYQKSKARISKKLLIFMQHVLNQLEVKSKYNTQLQDIKDSLTNLTLLYDEVTEDAHNLMNTYLSISAQKSNDVMKLLTIFSAFFLPLTFIAGLYGMNFKNMPELHWQYGYFATLGLMLFVSIVIFVWFKRNKII